eukprot:gene22448-53932_t
MDMVACQSMGGAITCTGASSCEGARLRCDAGACQLTCDGEKACKTMSVAGSGSCGRVFISGGGWGRAVRHAGLWYWKRDLARHCSSFIGACHAAPSDAGAGDRRQSLPPA